MKTTGCPKGNLTFLGSGTAVEFSEVSRFNRRGLFVGGCPKSGTTLLLSLLDGHPELAVFPVETHFFEDRRKRAFSGDFQARVRHLLGRPEVRELGQEPSESQPGFDFKHFASLAEEFVNHPGMDDSLVLSEVIRAYATAAACDWRNCVRWVEKTPSNVPCADDLFRLFPEAKLLHIVRDPRAVFASRRRVLKDRLGSHAKAHRLVREWNESSRQIERFQTQERHYMMLRYEDLIQNTRAVLEAVCRFAGIGFHPMILEPTLGGRHWQGNSAYCPAFSGIDARPVDYWKSELTAEEIWWIELHCHKGMQIGGYQPQSDATFSLTRWARRLPAESWGGYLRARKSSLCQMAGVLADCKYDPRPATMCRRFISQEPGHGGQSTG